MKKLAEKEDRETTHFAIAMKNIKMNDLYDNTLTI